MINIDIFRWLEFSANPDNQAMYGSFREMQEAFLRQQQGNDLAAPEPLANTESDESAQGTIEDKLKEIRGYQEYPKEVIGIFVHFEIAAVDYALNRGKLSDKTLAKHIDKARRKAFEEVQAIITTETTRLGASEKHQCICKDCGKQVDTRSEAALNPVGHGGYCPKHGGWSSQVPMMCPGCQEQGNDLIRKGLSQEDATLSRLKSALQKEQP